MIIVSNVEFSYVPFVEFSTQYYGYSPLFFPDSERTNKETHANMCASSYIQRCNCIAIIRTRLSELDGLKGYFFICIQKKSNGMVFLQVATNIKNDMSDQYLTTMFPVEG